MIYTMIMHCFIVTPRYTKHFCNINFTYNTALGKGEMKDALNDIVCGKYVI